MKVSALVNENKISARYRNAQKLVTIVDSQQTKESITAQNGKELIQRVNEIMPDALIISFAGPSIKFIDKNIEIYEVKAGIDLNDALKLYKSNSLNKYVNPYPPHSCGCKNCKICSP